MTVREERPDGIRSAGAVDVLQAIDGFPESFRYEPAPRAGRCYFRRAGPAD
jgi:hypothetical protein